MPACGIQAGCLGLVRRQHYYRHLSDPDSPAHAVALDTADDQEDRSQHCARCRYLRPCLRLSQEHLRSCRKYSIYPVIISIHTILYAEVLTR